MSNNQKSSNQKNNILVSSNEIEQFKLMLDNFGKDLSILNSNYNQLIDCNYFLFIIFNYRFSKCIRKKNIKQPNDAPK